MLIDRIKEVAKLKNMSLRKFSESIGFNYNTLNGYSTGNRKTIDASLLEKIASTFEDINYLWLLTGKGNIQATNEYCQNNQQITGDGNNMIGKNGSISINNEELKRMNTIIEEYSSRLKKQDAYIQELLSDQRELRQQISKLIDKL